jgi:uncharacterized protein
VDKTAFHSDIFSFHIFLKNKMSQNHKTVFDESHVLHELKHYLPSQMALKDFIHHNSLHAFQDKKFYDAIFKAAKVFGYQATLLLQDYRKMYADDRINEAIFNKTLKAEKGDAQFETWKTKLLTKQYEEHNEPRVGQLRLNWKAAYKIDLDTMVHPLLFRILCVYLDQGIAVSAFPVAANGLLDAIKELESNSFSSFFKTNRAKTMLLSGKTDLNDLLKIVVGDAAYFEQYLFDQQFAHRGWSGIASALEDSTASLLNPKIIALKDVIILELLMEIDALDYKFGAENWQPLCTFVNDAPVALLAEVEKTELQEVFRLWQDIFEWSYYDTALAGIELLGAKTGAAPVVTAKTFQAVFCIDERECSIRRYIELVDTNCETLGMPGFFGVEFYFKPQNAKFLDKLCPAPVTPKFLIKESEATEKREHDLFYHPKAHTLWGGYAASFTFGAWAAVRLVQNIFSPKMSPAISNAFIHANKSAKLTVENTDPNDIEDGLQVGFSIEEMSNRVEGALRGIGLIKNFAPIVYFVAHGSSSANNPHHGAHDCGACSGRPGSVNARVMATMANHPQVRAVLSTRGIDIPDTTQFLGSLHDTAADEMDFYDVATLSTENQTKHAANLVSFETALDRNAKERSRRFASINTLRDIKKVRNDIKKRSVSLFEPRPELGHGTNSLCVIGRRSLTKGLFFDRRAFMNSYDYTTDPEGKLLVGIMRPIGIVCGGINLEYYFSRVDNYKLGAGTKLPHNVMGLIGVANSSDGDLRAGLPLQMIEVHDPIRLLVIVEHFPDVVLKTVQDTPAMYEWYKNEWVHLVAVNPTDKKFYYFKNDAFHLYETVTKSLPFIDASHDFINETKEMETNHIVDATKENLPIFLIR